MNAKNELIEKLLKVAKRHKVLTYPVLALVAVISVINYFFSWSTGAGKRVVAVVMVLVLLVTQSYFLTSSANTLVDDANSALVQEELQTAAYVDAESSEEIVNDSHDAEVKEEVSEQKEDSNQDASVVSDTADMANEKDAGAENSEQADAAQDGIGNTDRVSDEYLGENTANNVDDGGTTGTDPSTDPAAGSSTDPVTPPANSNERDVTVYFDYYYYLERQMIHVGRGSSSCGTFVATDNKINLTAGDNFYTGTVEKNMTNPDNVTCLDYENWCTDAGYQNAVADITSIDVGSATEITLYCDYSVKKYLVTIVPQGGHCTVNETEYSDSSDKIVVDVNENLTFTNVNKLGYKLSGWQVGTASSSYSEDETNPDTRGADGALLSSFAVKLGTYITGEERRKVYHSITLDWTSDTYSIQLFKLDADDDTPPMEVTAPGQFIDVNNIYFDDSKDNFKFPGEDAEHSYVSPKTGYEFKGWSLTRGGTVDYEPGTSIASTDRPGWYTNCHTSAGKIQLYPVYEYRGIRVKPEDAALTFSYKGGTAQKSIEAEYTDGTKPEGGFQYSVASDSSVTKRLSDDFGITVDTTEGLVFKTDEGGPKQSTIKNPAPNVSIRIEDKHNPGYFIDVEFKITIGQFPVTLIPPADATKTYDGNNGIVGFKRTGDGSQGIIKTEEGYSVVFTISGSYYDDENAGERNIYLKNAKVGFDPAGNPVTNPDDFKINGDSNAGVVLAGEITKRPVHVSTVLNNPSEATILSGESSPSDVSYKRSANEKGGCGLLDGEDVSKLGTITYVIDPERTDIYEYGKTFRIIAHAADDSNYELAEDTVSGGWATFKVEIEDPVEDVNYKITGREEDTGWVIGDGGARFEAIGGFYDEVQLSSTAGGTGISNGIQEGQGTVWLRLRKSATNAVTTWKSIDIDIDQTKPQYKNFYVLTTKEGDQFYNSETMKDQQLPPSMDGFRLFFPTKGLLTFGSYFNKAVDVTVQFEDKDKTGNNIGSGLDKLYYGPAGAVNNVIDHFDSEGKATFELNAALTAIGKVQFYATDKAGNKSDTQTLRRVDKMTDGNDVWCVEVNGPNIEEIQVNFGASGQEYVTPSTVDSTAYYSNCVVMAKTKDDKAGIFGVEWKVNGTAEQERIGDMSASQHTWSFTNDLSSDTLPSGEYTVSASVFDNAGNESEPKSITFKLDNKKPIIEINEDYAGWKQSVDVEFHVTDYKGDKGGSGLKYVNVERKTADGTWEAIIYERYEVNEGEWDVKFTQEKGGEFRLTAGDKAGNVSVETITLNQVSKDVPDCPVVQISPELEDAEMWYNGADNLTATISKAPDIINVLPGDQKQTVPVITYYQLWEEGETAYNKELVTEAQKAVAIPGEGVYNLRVWAESKTGVLCDHADDADSKTHNMIFKVDKTAPKIELTAQKGNGTNLIVQFTVTDANSGVDEASIKVKHGDTDIEVQGQMDGTSYTGSFEITETGDYSIVAADVAGNVSEEAAFKPMSMKINAVKNITYQSATVGANVLKGTSEIKSASIAYRKYTDKNYITLDEDAAVKDGAGNVALSATLSDLDEDTAYVYKVTATSELGEVLEYEGYFKTLAKNGVGITIDGVVRYADSDKKGDVTVGLFKGNVCNMAIEIPAGSQFVFNNVPDGNYSIIATDGKYSKTLRVLIEDGMVIYPDTNIDIVLSGQNTSVVITTENTPNITVDNMDSIFKYDVINYSNEDIKLVETEGGVVEFKLYATLMTVAAVSAEEISAMYAATDSGKIVGAYLDLSLYKIVTDANGSSERSRVTELARGASVSITIPLGELAGKSGLEVVRIHNDGEKFLGRYLPDEDSNPSTYTISTDQFSTYAILYDGTPKVTEAPTTEAPKKEKPTTEKPTTEKPTTEKPVSSPATVIQEGTSNPSQNGTIYDGSSSEDNDEDEDEDDRKKPIEKNDSTRQGGTGGSSVGSLRSSGTAKTGDASPIAAMGGIMLISIAGIFVLRKKK